VLLPPDDIVALLQPICAALLPPRLALVRRHLWTQSTFPTSSRDSDIEKVPRALLMHLADLLCYAA
jgi:hypothetical protein